MNGAQEATSQPMGEEREREKLTSILNGRENNNHILSIFTYQSDSFKQTLVLNAGKGIGKQGLSCTVDGNEALC